LFYKSAEERFKQYRLDNFFGVDFKVTPPGFEPAEYSPYPRVWARPEECEYYRAHCIFKNRSTMVRSSAYAPKIEGLMFASGDNYRSDEYLNKICKYQGKMLSYELPIRHALRDNLPI